MSAEYLDALFLQLVDDSGSRPILRLAMAFGYRSEVAAMTVEVPAGFETDGASIPQAAMSLTGYPGMRAAVVHDYLVHQPSIMTREMADEVFREALAVSGVDDVTAGLMHAAVAAYTRSLRPAEERDAGVSGA